MSLVTNLAGFYVFALRFCNYIRYFLTGGCFAISLRLFANLSFFHYRFGLDLLQIKKFEMDTSSLRYLNKSKTKIYV